MSFLNEPFGWYVPTRPSVHLLFPLLDRDIIRGTVRIGADVIMASTEIARQAVSSIFGLLEIFWGFFKI